MKPQRPTQHDVAQRAGVSTAVVSAVLGKRSHGTIRVGPEARERVLRAAHELAYAPNHVARNLATGQTRLAAVFTFESIFPVTQRDFYFPFLLGIEKEAERASYDLLLLTSARDRGGGRRIFHDGISRLLLADGAIFLGRSPDKAGLADLAASEYPFVCVGRRDVPDASVSFVAAGYAAATAELTALLVELGHRDIRYLGVPDIDESAADREAGFQSAMRNVGLGHRASVVRSEPGSLTAAFLEELARDGVTALVIENDHLARRIEIQAASLRWSMPDRLSFVVLGDSLDPQPGDEWWTTFHIPREAMGRESLALLLDILATHDATPRRLELPCRFVPGKSTAPPQRHATSAG